MSQPWAELLLIIHVNLSRGPRDIHVHNGDNVRALALDFCASSCINLTHAGRIEEVIRVQVNRLAESWQSAPSMSASELAVDQAGSIVSSPRRSAVEQSPLENSGFTVSSSRETTAAKAAAPHHHSRQQAASASPAATPAPARSGPPRWEALHADSYDRKARLSLVRNHQSAVHMQRHSPNINRYDDGTGPKQHAVSNPLAAAPVFDLAGGAGPSISGGSAGATNSAWSSKQQQSAPSPSPSRGRKPPARQPGTAVLRSSSPRISLHRRADKTAEQPPPGHYTIDRNMASPNGYGSGSAGAGLRSQSPRFKGMFRASENTS